MTDRSSVRVLYIAGPTRSGSTLLSRVLGRVEGHFNAGELIDFFGWGMARNGICGCGQPFRSCDVWSSVVDAFPGLDPTSSALLARQVRTLSRSHRLLGKLIGLRGGPEREPAFRDVAWSLSRLYASIGMATGCRVIVDASKNLGYAHLLSQVPGIDLRLLHLVRDPRAVVYSWRRAKQGLRREPAWASAMVWNSRNLAAETLARECPGRYVRMRYEDFVREPAACLQHALSSLGERARVPRFDADNFIELDVSHSLYGNPDRFSQGRTAVRDDDEWRSRLSRSDRFIATALTAPLMCRYGYALRRRPAAPNLDAAPTAMEPTPQRGDPP
jgi:hypothetical protein